MDRTKFLPISKEDLTARGISQLDFVYIIADAYVDHPSFGPAIISRVLEDTGYTVGIIAQPDWKKEESIKILGTPRLGFLVSGGNMDSMVNHFTVNKKRRSRDAYSPGGKMGLRPDRATVVYCNLIRKVFGHIPVIIGGIEASLRRMAHYDYWKDKVMRSILLDSQADIISYGMGERSIVEIAEALNSGLDVQDILWIPGTVVKCRDLSKIYDYLLLPSFATVSSPDPAGKKAFGESFMIQYENTDPFTGKRLVEPYGDREFVVQNPPQPPLSQEEMDKIYALPYARTYHPVYEKDGGVPAISEIKYSLTSNRGCFGGCSFCALTFHQGRIVQTRSIESLLEEARLFTKDPDFKGIISDVGGPTANFRHPACNRQLTKGVCKGRQCLTPTPCKNLKADHREYMELLQKLRSLPGVKKVFVRSGIRFDYLMCDEKNRDAFILQLCKNHISGQLRVAPEHICDNVLGLMGKPSVSVYGSFVKKYGKINGALNKKQYVVPYLMSSHPGSGLKEAIALAEYVRDLGYMPEQVQDFYPTPSTISTCMYYTGSDPRSGRKVYVPRSPKEKAMQRALIQYRDPANYDLVHEALIKGNRRDLIGFGPKCLIKPRKIKR
jgi:uncharacterized radical SAM protein YgiQ